MVPSIDVQASSINRAAFTKLRELISPSWQSPVRRGGVFVDCFVGHPSVALEADSVLVQLREIDGHTWRDLSNNASAADEHEAATNECAAEKCAPSQNSRSVSRTQ